MELLNNHVSAWKPFVFFSTIFPDFSIVQCCCKCSDHFLHAVKYISHSQKFLSLTSLTRQSANSSSNKRPDKKRRVALDILLEIHFDTHLTIQWQKRGKKWNWKANGMSHPPLMMARKKTVHSDSVMLIYKFCVN